MKNKGTDYQARAEILRAEKRRHRAAVLLGKKSVEALKKKLGSEQAWRELQSERGKKGSKFGYLGGRPRKDGRPPRRKKPENQKEGN
jgi:hypothetical protein